MENENTLIEKDKGSDNIILYRTPFQQALEKYLEDYETKLITSDELKENFKRKMDELCQL